MLTPYLLGSLHEMYRVDAAAHHDAMWNQQRDFDRNELPKPFSLTRSL